MNRRRTFYLLFLTILIRYSTKYYGQVCITVPFLLSVNEAVA
jgi:hypothetical protein